MTLFRFLWLFDTAIALIALRGFILYLFKGPVTGAITGTWILALSLLGITMAGAGWLKICSYHAPALLLLFIMAAPAFVYLFLLVSLQVSRLKL